MRLETARKFAKKCREAFGIEDDGENDEFSVLENFRIVSGGAKLTGVMTRCCPHSYLYLGAILGQVCDLKEIDDISIEKIKTRGSSEYLIY
jgi:hypothetical protein